MAYIITFMAKSALLGARVLSNVFRQKAHLPAALIFWNVLGGSPVCLLVYVFKNFRFLNSLMFWNDTVSLRDGVSH